MSPHATLLIVWAALYGYAGAYFVVLYLRMRRPAPEHLAFAFFCFGLVVYAVGGALLVDGHTLSEGALAVRLRYLGGICAVGFYVDFVSHLVGAPSRPYVLLTYTFTFAAVLAIATGGLVDASVAVPGRAPGALLEPPLTLAGISLALVPVLSSVGATWVLARKGRRERALRIVVLGAIIGVPAGVHDVVVHATGAAPTYWLEHAGVIPVVAVSYALLGRFVGAARQLEGRTKELTRSYAELRETQQELVRKEQLAAVGELSAVIAHEVRNPLAVLKNAVSSLRRPTLQKADRGVLLGILDEETDRLNRLVRDLLAYARPVAPQGKPVPLLPVLERAVELARAGRREQSERIAIELDTHSGPLAVLGDAELLRHALVNVIDNALQAMSAGGTLGIRVSAASLDQRPAAAIAIGDTGEGMDTLVRAKALSPFFTTRAAGTGLGLAIVDRVVRNHGGTLGIESMPGAGTTVTLTLPVAEAS